MLFVCSLFCRKTVKLFTSNLQVREKNADKETTKR